MPPQNYTIGQAAARAEISAHTLRYYERIGLLPRVTRAANGHRRYTNHDLDWVHLLSLLRNTGMSVQKMLAFVRLERAGAVALPDQCELLAQHRARLEQRIRDLQHDLGLIDHKLAYYRGLKQQQLKPAPANGRARRPKSR